jgi:siderophore synthetase component
LSTAEREHAGWLRTHRPDLLDRFTAALPEARAAVMGRLWGAIVREPLPGTTVGNTAGSTVEGPKEAAEPFAVAPVGLTVGGFHHPADLAAALWPDRPHVAAELGNSVANLALARAAAVSTAASTNASTGEDLVDAEQSIVDGHPLHPCCRTRTGMTVADVLSYAPEHHPTVDLPIIAVPDDRWTATNLPPRLPMHPWQWRHVRDTYPWLRDTGERRSARPLISVRTLATTDAHLKTAVRIGMTSATRTVSAAAVHNGPALSRLLRPLSTATFGILAERSAGAALVDGEPCRDLVVRDKPALAPGERALPVAALTAGRPRVDDLTDDPVAFLRDFAGLLLPPLFTLLDGGIGLEAHGQNLILVTRNRRPHRLLYRDFGGVRVSPRMLARSGIEPPPLKGDIPSDDPDELETKVLASAVATVLAELVAYLSRRFHTAPETLWAAVPAPQRLRRRVDLPLKAMTAMRLADTVDDIWIRVPNPLAAR